MQRKGFDNMTAKSRVDETVNGYKRTRTIRGKLSEAEKASRKATRNAREADKAQQASQAKARREARRWAHRYTVGAIVASSALNGYQSYIDGGAGTMGWAGAAIGVSLPVAVWVLSKQAGWLWKASQRRASLVLGVVAAFCLACSLQHVSVAIASLAGTGTLLAWCTGIGVDVGLVSSEAASILVDDTD